jgi:hypothetical protein
VRDYGEVSEWSKERDWKSRMFRKGHRGFESLPLRQKRCDIKVRALIKFTCAESVRSERKQQGCVWACIGALFVILHDGVI